MTIKVHERGQMVFPAKLRKLDDIRAGDVFSVESAGRDTYRLQRLKRAESEPAKARLVKAKDGLKVFRTCKPFGVAEVQKLLEEFP
jgi:bifunctional DNA-binding transcriptional regulator/antitoxin component of YhaV-PrlF toxin-antitoxin module